VLAIRETPRSNTWAPYERHRGKAAFRLAHQQPGGRPIQQHDPGGRDAGGLMPCPPPDRVPHTQSEGPAMSTGPGAPTLVGAAE